MREIRTRVCLIGGAAFLLATAGLAVRAEETKGKWRFDIQVGNHTPGGRIDSQAQNLMRIVPNDPSPLRFVDDPRPDEGATQFTKSRGQARIEAHAAYTFAAFKDTEFILDFGVGFQRSRITGIELSYSFDATDRTLTNKGPMCETLLARGVTGYDPPPPEEPQIFPRELFDCVYWSDRTPSTPAGNLFPLDIDSKHAREVGDIGLAWTTERMEGGKLQSIPITVGIMARFRTASRLNPYVSAGAGYLVNSFDESARWKTVADQLEGSLVAKVRPDFDAPLSGEGYIISRVLEEFDATSVDTNEDGTIDQINVIRLGHRMVRPRIDTPNTAFAEARAGLEYQISPRWSIFGEGKFFWAQKNIRITADNQELFGVPTPALTIAETIDGEVNSSTFPQGGLPVYIIDGGLKQPAFAVNGEIVNDGANGQPGEYYLQGGQLKYGGWAFTAGVRFTL